MLQHEDVLSCCLFVILLFLGCSCSFLVLSFIHYIQTSFPTLQTSQFLPSTAFSPQIHSSSLFLQKRPGYSGLTTEHDMTRTVKIGISNHIKTEVANGLEERIPRAGRVTPTTTVRSWYLCVSCLMLSLKSVYFTLRY